MNFSDEILEIIAEMLFSSLRLLKESLILLPNHFRGIEWMKLDACQNQEAFSSLRVAVETGERRLISKIKPVSFFKFYYLSKAVSLNLFSLKGIAIGKSHQIAWHEQAIAFVEEEQSYLEAAQHFPDSPRSMKSLDALNARPLLF